jgi:benzodiazapine receptor
MTAIASKSQLRMSFLRYALVHRAAGAAARHRLGPDLRARAMAMPGSTPLKARFMPPGWVFGAAWTILYILLGLALALILHARGARGAASALALFVLQLLLNYAWSPIFFAYHEVGAAFWTIAR